MLVSLGLTSLVIASNPFLYRFALPTPALLMESLVGTLIIAVVGGAATAATFLVFRRGGEVLSRIVMAIFLSPVFFLLIVFVGETILLLLVFQGQRTLYFSLIAFGSIFFASLSIVLILSDAVGITGRNAIFAFYGLILAVFLGCSFSWYSSLAVLGVLAAEDTLFAAKLGPSIVKADPRRQARSAFAFAVGPVVIGVGDLVVAGALVAYSLRFFGWLVAALTAVAVLIGCAINTAIAARQPDRVIPGLPIPLLCALVPISASLLQLTALTITLGLL
jgi:hypothetical protein